jgi:hypothetical protein
MPERWRLAGIRRGTQPRPCNQSQRRQGSHAGAHRARAGERSMPASSVEHAPTLATTCRRPIGPCRTAGVPLASRVENAPTFNKARGRASVRGGARSGRYPPLVTTVHGDGPPVTTRRDHDGPPGGSPRPCTTSCSRGLDVAPRCRRDAGAPACRPDALASLTRLGGFWRDAGGTPALPGAARTPWLLLQSSRAFWRDAGKTPALRHRPPSPEYA